MKSDFIENDIILNDDETFEIDRPLYRATTDPHVNKFGNAMIDMCKATNLRIVNGRLFGDNNVGKCTCVTHNGQSLVDYLLTQQEDFHILDDFCVLDFNEFSNHAHVYFSLKTNYVPIVNCTGENSSHRWEQEYTSVFRDRISCGIGNLENILKNKIRDNCESNVLVYEFTNFLQACGDDLTRKTIKSKGNSFVNTDENRKEWFDRECQNKRKEYKEAIYEFNAQRNDDTRSKMLCKKREYRKTCKQHKLQFNRMLCLEMNDIRSKQPKRFWKMFKKKGADKSCNVSINDFFVHFKNLAQSVETDENIDFVNFVNDFVKSA